jgi:signal transduction histidine kinase
MKSSFRVVTFSIIIALVAIFSWQIYWLLGLYSSIKQETNTNINVALEAADRKELSYRMSIAEADSKKSGKERSISVHEYSSSNSKKVHVNFHFDMAMLDRLMKNMQGSIHVAIDSIYPLNVHIYDSLLVKECHNRGIALDVYAVDFVNLKTHRTIHYQSKKVSLKGKECVKYINKSGYYRYDVYITPMMKIVLWRMAGILAATLLIVILLGIAFWYLIHVILQQRTLEEMKDDFTNNMTHELKTPIAVAYAANDALLNFGADMDADKRKRYLTISKEQMQNLSGLVEHILSMSMERRKTFTLQCEDISLKELIAHIVEQYSIDQSIKISMKVAPDGLAVYADRTHLRNIIGNLVDNAVKYSGEDKRIEITAYSKDDSVYIKVTDNGIGITTEQQQHIFDKFYRVPTGNLQTVRGYGIGLFYVKTIAEKHGGTISVKSTQGKGSAFILKLPKNKY